MVLFELYTFICKLTDQFNNSQDTQFKKKIIRKVNGWMNRSLFKSIFASVTYAKQKNLLNFRHIYNVIIHDIQHFTNGFMKA